MALGDLTLLLVGHDSLAEQLHVHLEHRGADIERAEAAEALDTIRVAIPDLVIISSDVKDGELARMRDALASEAKPPRLLVLCEKKKAAQTGTYKLDFVATLEPELGSELIASSIESLCTLLAKQGDRPRPLRSLIADVRRSQLPTKPIAPLAAPPPAASVAAAAQAAPKPKATLIGTPPAAIAVPKPVAEAPKPVAEAPKPIAEVPKPIAEAPRASAVIKPLVAPIASAAPKPIEAPRVSAIPKTLKMPMVIAAPAPASEVMAEASTFESVESVPPIESVPAPAFDEVEPITAPEVFVPQSFANPAPVAPVLIAEPPAIATATQTEEIARPIATTPLVAELRPPITQRARALIAQLQPLALRARALIAQLQPLALRARALIAELLTRTAARLTRAQQAAAAAVLIVSVVGVAIASAGNDEPEQLAAEAATSLHSVAHQAAQPSAPALVSTTPAPMPSLAAAPAPAPSPPAPEPSVESEIESSVDDDGAERDGEIYDPKADPERARANFHVNAGHRLRKQGRLGMAEASYLKALEAMPNYARAVAGLVAVHLQRRDGVEALRWAKKLVALQPKRGAHHRMLGDAHALTGSTGAAKQAWHQGARLGDRVARQRMQ